jgi:hypothetical protein
MGHVVAQNTNVWARRKFAPAQVTTAAALAATSGMPSVASAIVIAPVPISDINPLVR